MYLEATTIATTGSFELTNNRKRQYPSRRVVVVVPLSRLIPEELWSQTLEKHRQRLLRRKVPIKALEYDNFQSELENRGRRFRNSKLVKCIRTITPALAQLNTFSAAISNFAQGQVNPCSFIWGALQVLFTVSSHFLASQKSLCSSRRITTG